jgi:hypothetical protein
MQPGFSPATGPQVVCLLHLARFEVHIVVLMIYVFWGVSIVSTGKWLPSIVSSFLGSKSQRRAFRLLDSEHEGIALL